MVERFSHWRAMKSSCFACALLALALPHAATTAAELPPKESDGVISGRPLADLPNFPIGYDLIQGTPPDGHIQRWIRYLIVGQQNHPFPIVFFSPQKFQPKTALELLIVLPDSEYKNLSVFTHSQPCTKQGLQPNNDQLRSGDIAEHGKETSHCTLLPVDACNYLSGITDLLDIKWTPAQRKLIHRLAMETNCKTNN